MLHEHGAQASTRLLPLGSANYDLVFIEQAARFPPELFTTHLKETHHCVWTVFSGCDIGEPKQRKRFRGCAIKKATLSYLGQDGNVTEDC